MRISKENCGPESGNAPGCRFVDGDLRVPGYKCMQLHGLHWPLDTGPVGEFQRPKKRVNRKKAKKKKEKTIPVLLPDSVFVLHSTYIRDFEAGNVQAGFICFGVCI